MHWYQNMPPIDFSTKHEVVIEDYDGTLRRMDEPYFKATPLAEKTWQILSDGDFSYLLAGTERALLIDGGYGCGSIRAFAEELCGMPVPEIANTHAHFDHTASNYLFDKAYMSKEAYPARCRPNRSFEGLDFPSDYPVEIIDEGYVFHLGDRDVEVFKFSDHSPGSLAFLDKKTRLFFSGDEMVAENYRCRSSLEHSIAMVKKFKALQPWYDTLCTGPGIFPAGLVDEYLEAFEYLYHHEDAGEPMLPAFPASPLPDGQHRVTFIRRLARPCDLGSRPDPDFDKKREFRYKGRVIEYWMNKLHEGGTNG